MRVSEETFLAGQAFMTGKRERPPAMFFRFMFFDALNPLCLKDFRAFYVFWSA